MRFNTKRAVLYGGALYIGYRLFPWLVATSYAIYWYSRNKSDFRWVAEQVSDCDACELNAACAYHRFMVEQLMKGQFQRERFVGDSS